MSHRDLGDPEEPAQPHQACDRSDTPGRENDRPSGPELGMPPSGDQSRYREDIKPAPGLNVLSLTALLLPVPWYVSSIVVVYWTGSVFVDDAWARTVLGLWLLSGAMMLWRPLEQAVAKLVFQVRHPIRSETDKLDAAWLAAARRVDSDGVRPSLMIDESNSISASTFGGRVVAVTRGSLALPPVQLEAALAHELGHHVVGYSLLRAVGLWYSLPARAATWIVRNFGRIVQGAPILGCLISGVILLILLPIILTWLIFGDVPVSLFGLPLLLLTPPILAWFDRLAEKNADKVAASWGYGPALLEILNDLHMKNDDANRRAGGRGANIMSSQPSVADRIRSLEEFLDQTSR